MQNSVQQQKIMFHHKMMFENLELQRKQRVLRMPINGVPFHKVVEEFCNKQIDLKSDYDSEIISRLLQLLSKSRKEIQALQKAFGQLKFFMEAQDYLAKKEFEGLLQEIQYEKFDKYQTVFEFDELGYKYYIILKGSVFVQIPNKNYKKYEDKQRLVIDLKKASQLSQSAQQNSKTSSRKNSSDSSSLSSSSSSSISLSDIPPQLVSPLKPLHSSQTMKNQNTKSQINGFKNYFQFQDQGATAPKNKNIEEIQKQNNQNARKSVILAKNAIKQVNKFASQLKHEKEKSQFSTQKLTARSQKLSPKSKQNLEDEEVQVSQTIEVDPKERIAAMFPQFDIVRQLEAGDAFGEIALMNNARRTASIICKEETTFAVLSKQSYDKILSQYHQAEQEKNISFLRELTIFNQLGKSKLDALYRLMEKQELKRNQIVYSEGDPAKYVYFIKEGEIQVSQQCVQQNEKKNKDEGDPEYSKMMRDYNLKWKGQHQKESLKRIKIAILGKNNYFGQEEIISNIPRLYMAEVFSTNAVLYCLSKQKFLSTVKMFSYSMEIMKQELSKRATWRISQLEKNLTTNKKIDHEIQKVQNEIVKLEFANQTLKEKHEVATQFIASDIEVFQKENQQQDYIKHGIIRSEKDVNEINEDILNQLKNSKKKKKQKQIIVDPKVKLFKLTLKNNLFKEETDKINQRMKKKIMSPRDLKSFLQLSIQKMISINSPRSIRGEMVKEILHCYDMKSSNQQIPKFADEQNQNFSKYNINSFQNLPVDYVVTPFNTSVTNLEQKNEAMKKFKTLLSTNLNKSNDFTTIKSQNKPKNMFKSQRFSLDSKYILYDENTPQNNKSNIQDIISDSQQIFNQKKSSFQIKINDKQSEEIQIKDQCNEKNHLNRLKQKRIQSAHPKLGSNSTKESNHQKFIIFPSSSLQGKQDTSKNIQSMVSITNINSERRCLSNFKSIQQERLDSPILFYKPQYNQNNLQAQLFTNLQLGKFAHSTIYQDNTSKNNTNKQNKSGSCNNSPTTKQQFQMIESQQNDKKEEPMQQSMNVALNDQQQIKKNIQNTNKSKSICSSEFQQKILQQQHQQLQLQKSQKQTKKITYLKVNKTFSVLNLDQKTKSFFDTNKTAQTNNVSKVKASNDKSANIHQNNQINNSNNINVQEQNQQTQPQDQVKHSSDNQKQIVQNQVQQNSNQNKDDSQQVRSNISIVLAKESQIKQNGYFNMKTSKNSSENILKPNLDDTQTIFKRKRPQSSLIGSTLTQSTVYLKNMVQSPDRISRKDLTMSHLCSPISGNEFKPSFEFFSNTLNTNKQFRMINLSSPMNIQQQNQSLQQPNEFKYELNNQAQNQTLMNNKQNQINSFTQINQNAVSLQDLLFYPSNRSQLTTPTNQQFAILRPRSSKITFQSKVNDAQSKNIHMDKLRFLKKDLEIKDPFKNNSKQFKKLMSASTRNFTIQQTPKSQLQIQIQFAKAD
ncbi:hypothetical protein ABPG72_005652 [Tetrahymena utriculariae]